MSNSDNVLKITYEMLIYGESTVQPGEHMVPILFAFLVEWPKGGEPSHAIHPRTKDNDVIPWEQGRHWRGNTRAETETGNKYSISKKSDISVNTNLPDVYTGQLHSNSLNHCSSFVILWKCKTIMTCGNYNSNREQFRSKSLHSKTAMQKICLAKSLFV